MSTWPHPVISNEVRNLVSHHPKQPFSYCNNVPQESRDSRVEDEISHSVLNDRVGLMCYKRDSQTQVADPSLRSG